MIYFLKRLDIDHIKIGTTEDLAHRLKKIAAVLGHEPEVLAVMDGSFPKGRAIHAKFASLRVEGEWFEAGPDLVDFIEKKGRGWTKLAEVKRWLNERTGPAEPLAARNLASAMLDWISGKLADADLESAWDGAFSAGAKAKKGAKV